MALATLTIDLIAQLAELQKGMDRGVAIASGAASRIEGKLNGLASVAKGVGAAIGGALAVGGLTTLFRTAVDGIDALNDLADATGSSVENLSALENAAKRTGTGVDVVGSALVKLNKTLAEAKPGSEQAAVLQAIGLNAAELRKLDPAEALLKVAQALSAFDDNGNKARITQELFGESVREVAPLLKDLVEQGQLNATVTEEQAAEASRFNKEMAAAKKNAEDLSRTIASALIPALNKLFERGKKEGFFSALFTPDEVARLQAQAEEAGNAIAQTSRFFERALRNSQDQSLPGSARAKWAQEADKLRAQLTQLQNQAVKTTAALRVATGGPAESLAADPRRLLRQLEADSATRPDVPDIVDPALLKRYDDFVQRLREAMFATQDLSEVERTRLALTRPEMQGLTESQREYLLVLAAVNDEMRGRVQVFEDARDAQVRLAKQSRSDVRSLRSGDEQLPESQRNLIASVDALAAQSRQAQIKQLAAALTSVREQMAAGGGSADTYRQALEVLAERMRSLEDNANGLAEKLGQGSEEAKQAAGQIQDALGASLVTAMEGNARKIDRIWGDLLRQLVAKAGAAKLAEALFGKSFTSTGDLGGWVGRLIGLVGGGGSTGGAAGTTNNLGGEIVKNSLTGSTAGKLTAAGVSKSQASASGGVTQNVYVQGDVGTKARRAMLGVAAQIQARNQRQAAI